MNSKSNLEKFYYLIFVLISSAMYFYSGLALASDEDTKGGSQELLEELKKVSIKVQKTEDDILQIIQNFSNNSVSFHEFIEDINKDYSKEDKLSLLSFLWSVAYADSILEVNEERLIRRIADLIHLKDMDVLKIKDKVKNNNI